MKRSCWLLTVSVLLMMWPIQTRKSIGANWLDRVVEDIQQKEYEFSKLADGSWSAPNRAQDLRTRISASGVSLTSRTRGEQFWTLEMRLGGLGAGKSILPAKVVGVTAQAERAQIERHGVTEWYVNGTAGLEQGFTISSRPRGGSDEDPLILDLEFLGTVSGTPAGDGRTVLFNTASGTPVLRYGELKVTDASGKSLHSTLDLDQNRIRISIQDAGARYPIVVDPLLTAPWGSQGDQASARLGFAVATAGDVNGDGFSDLLVGAPLYDSGQPDEGKVFLYHGSATGPGTTPAWSAEGDEAGGQLGYAVATAGDVDGDGFHDVILGGPYLNGFGADCGVALVFLGSASGMGAPGNPSNADWFGTVTLPVSRVGIAVGTAGDVNGDGYDEVIIGADMMDDGSQTDEGWVLVWYGSATGLGEVGTQLNVDWTAQGNQFWARLGASAGTAGDVNGDGYDDLIVAAPQYDNQFPFADEGRVFVWLGSATGLGPNGDPTNADWLVAGNQDWENLGRTVAAAGDVDGDGYADVLVGTPMYDNGQVDEGVAFLYRGGSSGLAGTPAWTVEGEQANAQFGAALATAGDLNGDGFADVAVGAPLYDNGQSDEGRAFVYQGGAGGLATVANWTAEGDQAGAQFGNAVATAGDVDGNGFGDLLVGSSYFDNPETDEGQAFLYSGSAAGPATTAGWQTDGTFQQVWDILGMVNQHFGSSLGTLGDINGDGYSDFAVGAPLNDRVWLDQFGNPHTDPDTGRAIIYLGSRGQVPTLGTLKVSLASQGTPQMGFSVAAAGDTNGDGFGDFIVGAPYFDAGDVDEGRAFLYIGKASGGFDPDLAWWAEGNQANAQLGFSVGTAGDVNGDGFSDVIIGAKGYDDGTQTDEGGTFVWLGGPCNLPDKSGLGSQGVVGINEDWKAEGNAVGAGLGASVGTAGDVNRDGYSDVIVGAPGYQSAPSLAGEGRALVYLGSASGLSQTPVWSPAGGLRDARFGSSVGTAGDVNGDGFSDVIVGAPLFGSGQQNEEGRASVYLGGSSGPATTASWNAEGNQSRAQLGTSVATAGDVNGDGFSDVVVGAPLYDAGQDDEGRSFVYLGSGNGLGASAAWTAESDEAGAQMGYAVATAGDVNGDGFADVLVGAPLFNNGLDNDRGYAYLFYGNGGRGLDRLPQQDRDGNPGRIQLLGKTYGAGTSFRPRVLGRTTAGRGKVRLQWEAKPLGTAFDGTGTGATNSFDTGTPASDGSGSKFSLTGVQSGLTLGANYAWKGRILTDSPFFPRSPWFSMPYNGRLEADLRALGGSLPVCSLPCICEVSFCSQFGVRCYNSGCCTSGFCSSYNCCKYDNCVSDPSCDLLDECPRNLGNPAGTCLPCGG